MANPGPGVTHGHTNMLGSTPGLARAPWSLPGRRAGSHSCRFHWVVAGEQARPRQRASGAGAHQRAASAPRQQLCPRQRQLGAFSLMAWPEAEVGGNVCHGPLAPAVPSGHSPSSPGDPGDAMVAGSPSQEPGECQVLQGLAGSWWLQWAWGHLPSLERLWLRAWGVAFACFGTYTRSSHLPVVPRPCLASLCRAFSFASVVWRWYFIASAGRYSRSCASGCLNAIGVNPHRLQSAAVN